MHSCLILEQYFLQLFLVVSDATAVSSYFIAFMAPEVITQKGHGRASDIWSLGCVVVEMVTGKRPWFDLENIHQIMFKVRQLLVESFRAL